jgi:hypothetical protein
VSPVGTIEVTSIVPTGLTLLTIAHPALKRWAIVKVPFGTKIAIKGLPTNVTLTRTHHFGAKITTIRRPCI